MGQVDKKKFMRIHECRLCVYYESCSHDTCRIDGASADDKKADSPKKPKARKN